jgi:hypothetical protein
MTGVKSSGVLEFWGAEVQEFWGAGGSEGWSDDVLSSSSAFICLAL